MAAAADAHQQRSASNPFLPPSMSELRVVLLGNSWSQRRDVGNFILGETVFNTEEPDCCVRVSGRCRWKEMVLINTPDLLHPNISEDKLTEFVKNCVRLSAPGPHVFLLVLQPEDFTEEQRLRLQTVLEDFADQSFEHSLVLISTPAKQHLAYTENYKQHPPLRDLIRTCRYRHLKQRDLELQELLTRLGQMVKENNGEHVSCDLTETGAGGSHPSRTAVPANMDPARAAARGLRIVLFGKSEEEKTTFGNFITKKNSFQFRNISPAKHCEAAHGAWREEPLTAVKTPDMFGLSVERVREETKSCVSLCPPGPNVLLLLAKPSDFTEENRKTLKFILSLFGGDFFKHSMIVSTHRHQWKETSISVNKLLQDCDGRHYNMSANDLQLLMEKIEDMVQQTKGTFLTFTEENAEMKLEKPKGWERKEKEWQENHQQEIQRIRQEEEEKHKKIQEEFEQERKKYENQRKEDGIRREQEEKKRKVLEENYRSKMEEMTKTYKEEARKQEFNEIRAKYQKDLEAWIKNQEKMEALQKQHEKEMQQKPETHRDEYNRLQELSSYKEEQLKEQLEQKKKVLKEETKRKEIELKEEMDKKIKEARRKAEEFNEIKAKYQKDLEAQMEQQKEMDKKKKAKRRSIQKRTGRKREKIIRGKLEVKNGRNEKEI